MPFSIDPPPVAGVLKDPERARTSRHKATCSLVALSLLLLLGGCGHKARPAMEIPVYFTCDTQGRLEPCGCFVGQFGGLTRLKTVLDSTGDSERALRVDAGDSIGGHEDYDLLQYGYMLRAFAAMGYHALNIGAREARLSAKQLQQIRTTSPVSILSANVLDNATGKPIFDTTRIVQRGPYRIGLVGVVDPAAVPEPGEGLRIESMDATLHRLLPELRSQTDAVILLAFADETAMAGLARKFYELHVILGGRVRQPAQELHRENRSLIYFVTNEARALGILRLKFSDQDPVIAATNQILFLHDRIPQDAVFRDMAAAYRAEVRQTRLSVDDIGNLSADSVPGVRAPASYVGSETCITCHPSAAEVWRKSTHSQAFKPLLERGADADPKCIGCHTVGFGSPSGYRRELGAGKLVQVGCESCHGPGSLHVRVQEGDASVNFRFRPLDGGDCKTCHHGEFSRPFDWETFWPPIRHGKEPAPAALQKPGRPGKGPA